MSEANLWRTVFEISVRAMSPQYWMYECRAICWEWFLNKCYYLLQPRAYQLQYINTYCACFLLLIFVYICFISWFSLHFVFYETKSFYNSVDIHGIIQEHGLQVKNRDYSIVSLALLFCWLQIVATSSAREQEKYALANRVADQVLNNVRTVLAFGKQDYEIQR